MFTLQLFRLQKLFSIASQTRRISSKNRKFVEIDQNAKKIFLLTQNFIFCQKRWYSSVELTSLLWIFEISEKCHRLWIFEIILSDLPKGTFLPNERIVGQNHILAFLSCNSINRIIVTLHFFFGANFFIFVLIHGQTFVFNKISKFDFRFFKWPPYKGSI